MKPVPGALIAMIQSQRRMLYSHLYTIYMADGSQDYFTDLDMPITYNGITYKADGIRIEGMKMRQSVGLEVDEQDIKIYAAAGDTVTGAAFLAGVVNGLLDGAYIARDRAVWAVQTGNAFLDYSAAPIAVYRIFYGRVSTITKVGRSVCELKVKSPLLLMNIDMPHNHYSPSCLWTLYDQGCTVNRASFTQSYVITSADRETIIVAAISPQTGADGNPYYAQGRLKFTSGTLNNLQTTIAYNTDVAFSFAYPLHAIPNVGDTFDASAGCYKTMAACDQKFNNLLLFRGFPFVPPVVAAL